VNVSITFTDNSPSTLYGVISLLGSSSGNITFYSVIIFCVQHISFQTSILLLEGFDNIGLTNLTIRKSESIKRLSTREKQEKEEEEEKDREIKKNESIKLLSTREKQKKKEEEEEEREEDVCIIHKTNPGIILINCRGYVRESLLQNLNTGIVVYYVFFFYQ
jgi:hypothetical protein